MDMTKRTVAVENKIYLLYCCTKNEDKQTATNTIIEDTC